jgi:Tfp pilus assembly protein PilF
VPRPRRHLAILTALTLFSLACGPSPEQAARRHYDRGTEYSRQGRYAEAIIEFRNALQESPRDGEAYYALADAYAASGEPEFAGKNFELAAEFLPDRTDVQLRVGALLLNDGRWDRARLRADHVLQRDPENVDALLLKATALAGLRQLDQAISDVEEALRSQPDESRLQTHLGNLQLAKGQPQEAEATLRRALELNPKAVAAHLSLGNHYWAVGRREEAQAELSAAIGLEPSNATANRAQAALYLATGRTAEAERHLLRWAETSGQPGARLAVADFYARTGRADLARQQYALVNAPGTEPIVIARLAALDLAVGQKDAAEKQLIDGVARNPRSEHVLLPLAQLLFGTGRFADARQRVDALLEAHPTVAPAWLLRGKLLQREGNGEEAGAAYRQAVRLNPRLLEAHLGLFGLAEAGGDAEAAVQHAREALGAWPGHPAAHLALARGYTMRRNYDSARDEVRAALAANPGWMPAELQLGLIAAAEGRHLEARKAFERVLAGSPDNMEAFASLVKAAMAEGQLAEAARLVQQRLESRPNDATLLMLSASVAQAQGDTARTERILRRVIEVSPDSHSAYEVLGRLYISQQRFVDARRTFTALASRHPRPAGAHVLLASAFEAEGNLVEARRQYEKALELDPKSGAAANNLAWLLAQHDDTLADALGYATAAQRLLPRQPEVLDTLGWVYYRQGAGALAISWFERAVEAAPDEPTYRFHLALAHQKAGRADTARTFVKQALESKRAFAGRQEAERLLADLSQGRGAGQKSRERDH